MNIVEPKSDGFNPSSITQCCKGKELSHKNYIWNYEQV